MPLNLLCSLTVSRTVFDIQSWSGIFPVPHLFVPKAQKYIVRVSDRRDLDLEVVSGMCTWGIVDDRIKVISEKCPRGRNDLIWEVGKNLFTILGKMCPHLSLYIGNETILASHALLNAPYCAQVSRRLCSFAEHCANACCINLCDVISLVCVPCFS